MHTDSPGVSSPGLVHGLDGRFLGDALDCVLQDAVLLGEFRELTLKSLPLIRRGTSAWVSSVTGRSCLSGFRNSETLGDCASAVAR